MFFVAPLMITLLSIPLLGEKVGPLRLGAVVVGLVGVVIMTRPWAGGGTREVAFGVYLLPVVAALSYALNQLLTRKLGGASRASALAVYIQGGFIVVSLGFWIVAGDGRFADGLRNESLVFLLREWTWPEGRDVWLFAGLGANSAVIGYCLSAAYRAADAATVAPFEYVGLPLAIFWGWVVWGELPGPVVMGHRADPRRGAVRFPANDRKSAPWSRTGGSIAAIDPRVAASARVGDERRVLAQIERVLGRAVLVEPEADSGRPAPRNASACRHDARIPRVHPPMGQHDHLRLRRHLPQGGQVAGAAGDTGVVGDLPRRGRPPVEHIALEVTGIAQPRARSVSRWQVGSWWVAPATRGSCPRTARRAGRALWRPVAFSASVAAAGRKPGIAAHALGQRETDLAAGIVRLRGRTPRSCPQPCSGPVLNTRARVQARPP